MVDLNNVVENDSELKLYLKKICEIENYLKTFGKQSFWQIEQYVGGSERRIMRLLNEMVDNNIICFDESDLKFYVRDNEIAKHKSYKCICCNGSTIELNDLKNIIPILKIIWNRKPKPTLLFDQRPVTLKTSLKRVAYLLSSNDVYKKKIVFLGDDDLTGVCLALANKDCDVTVLDADERLIYFVNEIASEYNLRLEAKILNVMSDVPNELKEMFDVLMTDPTPEKVPFTVFMNTSIDLLKSDGILYTSIYSSAMEKNMDLQRVITDMNLYITEMIPNFTHYQYIYDLYSPNDIRLIEKYHIQFSEDSICFTETLFRMEKSSETKKQPIEYKGEQMMGKATKRVMKYNEKEIAEDTKYLDEVRKSMEKNLNKIYRG